MLWRRVLARRRRQHATGHGGHQADRELAVKTAAEDFRALGGGIVGAEQRRDSTWLPNRFGFRFECAIWVNVRCGGRRSRRSVVRPPESALSTIGCRQHLSGVAVATCHEGIKRIGARSASVSAGAPPG